MKRKNKFSDWREDLIEVAGIPEKEPKTDTDSEKEITEKKVKNKIVINPSMKEAFEEIGGTLLEVTELEHLDEISKKLARSYVDKATVDRDKNANDWKSTGSGEAFNKAENREKNIQRASSKLYQGTPAGKIMGTKNPAKVPATGEDPAEPKEKSKGIKGFVKRLTRTEAMSVVDQMKASAKYWKENPRKDYKAGDGVKRNERDARANAARKPKDTRTSQQRMNDAVGKSRAGESD